MEKLVVMVIIASVLIAVIVVLYNDTNRPKGA